MGSPYGRAAQGGGGGSLYGSGRARGYTAGAEPKKHKGGGGLLGTLERIPGDTLRGAYHMALNAPAGVFHLAEAPVLDTIESFTRLRHPGRHYETKTHSGEALIGMGKSAKGTLEHPLRDPAATIATLLPVGEGVFRAGEAASALRAGAGTGEAAARLVGRGTHAPRTLEHEGAQVELPTSRSALGRAGQKAWQGGVLEQIPSLKVRRVSKELGKTRRVTEQVERGPAVGLAAETRKLSPAEQTALRTVAEGVKTRERIAYHRGRIRQATDAAERTRHEQKIQVLEDSKQHLDERGPEPKLHPDEQRLQTIYAKTREVAQGREDLLAKIGKITPEAAQGRVSGPGRVIRGARFERPTLAGATSEFLTIGRRVRHEGKAGVVTALDADKGRATVHFYAKAEPDATVPLDELHPTGRTRRGRLVGAEDFTGGEFRVPYTARKAPRTLQRPARGPSVPPGQPRLPGSVTQQFKGGLLRSGDFRDETTRLVAESSLEAQRLGSVLRLREQVKQAAKDEPTNLKHDVPMRLDALKPGGLSPEEQALLERVQSGALSAGDEQALRNTVQKIREHVFPHQRTDPLTDAEVEQFRQMARDERIGWVDRRLLSKLDQQTPTLQSVIGRRPTSFVDAVNNAGRAAFILLKPAYAIPNLLGNTALTLIQQGPFAIGNLGRAVMLNSKLGAEIAARVDDLMGEGIARSLMSERGLSAGAINKLANAWGKVVDTPFRRASFLYEARRAGFETPEQIRALLEDEAHRGELVKVTRRANEALIDYSDLSPKEREFIRRIVFVYPWVKGSTKYAGHFVREHPVQAGVAGTLGAQAYQQSQQELGPYPSWFEGSFKVGGTEERPLVVNPASVSMLETPAHLGAALAALVTGHPSRAADLTGYATPAVQFVSDLAHQRGLKHALTEQVVASPQYRAATGATSKTYEGSSLPGFLVGGVVPRTVRREQLRKGAGYEKRGR